MPARSSVYIKLKKACKVFYDSRNHNNYSKQHNTVVVAVALDSDGVKPNSNAEIPKNAFKIAVYAHKTYLYFHA